jgi:hypothetical protein
MPLDGEADLTVKFLLVCEGSSDRGLIPHLEGLCVRAGAAVAMGDAPDLGRLPEPPGKAIEKQARAALDLAGGVNLLFAHQDSDGQEPEEVRRRIRRSLAGVESCPLHVCIVPVQELEAWLLLDEGAIRAIAGSPNGTEDLNLPLPRLVEKTPKPKERLKAAFSLASGKHGRRYHEVTRAFSEHRAMLLQRLDVDGPIRHLPAWQQLVADVEAAIADLAGGTSAKRRSRSRARR